MEDVTKIVQDAIIPIDGKKVVLPGVDIRHWGIIQKEMIARKQANMLLAVNGMKGKVSDADYKEMRTEALQEAGRIIAVGHEDMTAMLTTSEGVALIIWVLAEDKYPGTYTEEKILCSLPELTEDSATLIISQLQSVLGIEPDDDDGEPVGNDGKASENEAAA